MGDATPLRGDKNDGIDEAPPGSETDTALKDFIFARELAEVYLLLDHVSTSKTKRLQKNYADLGIVDNGVKSFVADICKITWPPKDNSTIPADQAATLILALDTLNSYVAPATGASIAFTTLVAGGDEATPEPARLPVPGRFTSYPTRQSLATWAFPSLPRSAKRFKRWTLWVVCALVIWLVLTCALSWNVATGNALLAQLNTLTVEQQTIERKIATAGSATADEADFGRRGDQEVGRHACERHRPCAKAWSRRKGWRRRKRPVCRYRVERLGLLRSLSPSRGCRSRRPAWVRVFFAGGERGAGSAAGQQHEPAGVR